MDRHTQSPTCSMQQQGRCSLWLPLAPAVAHLCATLCPLPQVKALQVAADVPTPVACGCLLVHMLQILRRPADIQPGSLKAMDLKGDGYHMTVSGMGEA